MTTTTDRHRSLHYKPLTSLERAALRIESAPAKMPTMNLSFEMARAKADPVATARLLAAIEGGARAV